MQPPCAQAAAGLHLRWASVCHPSDVRVGSESAEGRSAFVGAEEADVARPLVKPKQPLGAKWTFFLVPTASEEARLQEGRGHPFSWDRGCRSLSPGQDPGAGAGAGSPGERPALTQQGETSGVQRKAGLKQAIFTTDPPAPPPPRQPQKSPGFGLCSVRVLPGPQPSSITRALNWYKVY